MDRGSATIYPIWTMFIEIVKIVVFFTLADVTVSAYKLCVEILKIGLGEMPAITGAIIVSLIFQAAFGFPVYNVITELEQIIYCSLDEQIIYRPYRVQNVCYDLLLCALSPLQFFASAGEFLFTARSRFYTGFAAYCARTVLHVTVIFIIIDQLGKWEI